MFSTRPCQYGENTKNPGKISLNPCQIIALSEISIELKNNGDIKKRPRHFDFKEILQFTYKTYCDCFKKEIIYKNFISDNRFSDFTKSINMRHRITHPKSIMDVFISGENIQTVMSAGEWYHEFMFEIFMDDLIKQE